MPNRLDRAEVGQANAAARPTRSADVSAEEQYGSTRRLLFQGELIEIGTFRCAPHHPLFRDSGPIRRPVVVFPRTAGEVHYEGQRPFFASPLVSPFYNAGQRYERRGVNIGGDRSDWISIRDESTLRELVREVDPAVDERADRPFRFRFAPCSPTIYGRQRMLFEALRNGRAPEATAVEEEALAIVRAQVAAAYSARGLSFRPAPPPDHELLGRAMAILHRSYRERLTLVGLARELGIGAPYLVRLFRRHRGASVHRTLVELRLREALERLEEPRVDLSRLAVELGFSSHSHFTAAFRRAFGRTPSEARGAIAAGDREWRERRRTGSSNCR